MKPFPTLVDNLEEFKKLFQNVDYILTDCDGVLFLQNHVIPGANTFLNNARKLGKQVVSRRKDALFGGQDLQSPTFSNLHYLHAYANCNLLEFK